MKLLTGNSIRKLFSEAISEMYQQEMPLYADLKQLVESSNAGVINPHDEDYQQTESQERHGAIRLGTPAELNTMRRFFAVMDMYPVGYYDLTVAHLPVYSTAFRPVNTEDLAACPFRMFTSLLRIDLIEDPDLKEIVTNTLTRRNIFTDKLITLIDSDKKQQGLSQSQTDDFIKQSLTTFRWNPQATVSRETYQQLTTSHKIIADIVCFSAPHINHLTAPALDIDCAHQEMINNPKFIAKNSIEGPPKRSVPILLRQTSFLAQGETVSFSDETRGDSPKSKQTTHMARFGEIEQRGIALTPKGRQLYDRLLSKTHAQVPEAQVNPAMFELALNINFKRFPDNLETLRQEGLIYVTYTLNDSNTDKVKDSTLESLIQSGHITYKPITYEDFLPISAAGIFRSNLGDTKHSTFDSNSNQHSFETALGCPVIDPSQLYESMQNQSLLACKEQLKHHKNEEPLINS